MVPMNVGRGAGSARGHFLKPAAGDNKAQPHFASLEQQTKAANKRMRSNKGVKGKEEGCAPYMQSIYLGEP